MAQINDAKKATLANLGYTGPIDEAYHNYLAAETGSDLDATQDLEKLLFTTLGYTGSLYDMWFEFLRDNGFTNSLQDMLYAFWNSDDAGLSPLHFSEFYSPLEYTAVPTRAAAGTTATFTRATTATVRDNEGVLRTAIAGEARFEGARRVRNLAKKPEDITAAGGGYALIRMTSVIGATDPNEGATAYTLTATGAAAELYLGNAVGTVGTSLLQSWYIRRVTGTGNITTVNANGGYGTKVLPVTSSWSRVSDDLFTATGTTVYVGLVIATSGDVIEVWHPQLEDITGRADQTTPSEYVSVGVESAPAYHGSFVDGVKCFPTDLAGNPIPASTLLGYLAEGARTNLCLQSNAFTTTWTDGAGTLGKTQSVIGPDGATSAWTITDSDAANACHLVSGAITLTAAAYTASIFIKKTSGATTFPIFWFIDVAGTTTAVTTIDTNNGIATVWTSNGYALSMMASASARCSSFNTDYWRVELTATGTAASYYLKFGPALTTNATQSSGTFTNTVQGSAVFYGAQIELGSSASSYIATTTTAVTRNADLLTYTGGDIPNLKTLSATFKREVGVSSTGVIAQLDDGTANDLVITYLSSATAIRHQGTDGGAVQWNLPVDAVSTYVPGTTCKSAQTWATNDVKAAVNGATLTGDTAATVPTVTQLTVGHQLGTLQLNGNVGGIYGWTRNFSQSELNAVTA